MSKAILEEITVRKRFARGDVIFRERDQASEAFVTSATSFVMPVIKVDGAKVGAGTPGPVARRLRTEYLRHADTAPAS